MPVATSHRSRFPLTFGLAMLAILLAGFGPSFFFRPLTDRPHLPAYLVVHAVAGTAWFVLFLAQVTLAAQRQLQWHRQLGMLGIALAVVFVTTGVQSTLAFTHKLVERGDFVATNGSGEAFVYWAIATSYGGLLMFTTLLATALLYRRRPEVHGRLMLLATSGLMGPAVARMIGWVHALPSPLMIATLLFLAAIIVHDVRTRGRPHMATVIGGLYAYGLVATLVFSGFGRWVYSMAAS
jgi:hypothetical protein